MTIDSTKARDLIFDACIVGTGPAGLTLALELAKLRPSWRILMVEYGFGDEAKNDLDDSISIQTPKNHHPPEECTNKGFGGTSRTWGGRCVSYDEIDFQPRSIIGDGCTWSVDLFKDVKGFFETAGAYLDCGEPLFDLSEIKSVPKRRISEKFVEGDFSDSKLERWSLPTRFNTRYEEEVHKNASLYLLDGCKIVRIRSSNGNIDCLEAMDRRTGSNFEIRANQYIIAAGAQESTRLLLKSPEVFENLESSPPSLGLYYQGHISGKIASVKFKGNPRLTDFGFLRHDGIYLRRRFQIPADVLLRENLLNTSLMLDNPLYFDPSHRSGTMSVIYLMMLLPVIGKRLAPPAIAQSVTKGRVYSIKGHLANIIRGLPLSLIEPLMIFFKRYLPERKLPGVFLYNSRNEYALHFHGEQVPSANNRMELGEDGETLVIHYGYEKADVDSVIRTHALLDRWLRKTGSGELVYWFSEAELVNRIDEQSKDGVHQVGTTRISDDRNNGVLDSNLRVWGTDNLYVCSSSAFPTSSHANPTFLLVAFAVRLAHHLVTL